MALTFANAITVAQMELNKIQRFGQIYALVPENACETPYGWLIPWSQSDHRFTKEVTLGGNAPFFVDRFSGAVCQVSVIHHDFQQWLRAYALRQGYSPSQPEH